MKMLAFILLFLIFIAENTTKIIKSKYLSLEDTYYFSITTVKFEIEKSNNIYNTKGFSIPSDILYFLKPNKSLSLIINQGRLPKLYNEKYYQPNSKNFINNNLLFDYPSGYFYFSENMTPFNDWANFRNFFDVFSYNFKITQNAILDRSSHINIEGNFFMENAEKACTDHLDAIKDILPYYLKNEFSDIVDYNKFVESDYKSIKYSIDNKDSHVKFTFKVIYKLDKAEIVQNRKISNLIKNDNLTYINYRNLIGDRFGFENFQYNNIINLKIDKLNSLQIIDIIPDQLNILLSTINCNLELSTSNLMKFSFNSNNINEIFDIKIVEGSEEQNPVVPFTYENKKSIKVFFSIKSKFIKNYLKDYDMNNGVILSISYKLRKILLNFESYENEAEYGYKFPCGLILINSNPFITNHIYYNMPSVDNTMPFNIIAFTWVVFGFLFIQTLNIFLQGSKQVKEKTIWQTLKDRFMAKWGFLFGR